MGWEVVGGPLVGRIGSERNPTTYLFLPFPSAEPIHAWQQDSVPPNSQSCTEIAARTLHQFYQSHPRKYSPSVPRNHHSSLGLPHRDDLHARIASSHL
ncbi:hypothetical protein CEP53_003894 [Fusarium sp. AF-6]|nr:hypothetical protein CEP53_003894 [Fusarium sp. AF-6]